MDYLDENLTLELPLVNQSIIKVIGIGDCGVNNVNYIYRKGICDVDFVVCNTDKQTLLKSPVPIKILLGSETTAGQDADGDPEIGRIAAEESIDQLYQLLIGNTKMVFIVAGMGGGTGTGAAPVIAKVAHDLDILTVGIVILPFSFEGNQRIRQSFDGITSLSKHMDTILMYNNENMMKINRELELSDAFAKIEEVLANTVKGICEIITLPGYLAVDFADVYSVMKNGHFGVTYTGYASGENRITKAIYNALNISLLNTDENLSDPSGIIITIYYSKNFQMKMEEVDQIHDFMSKDVIKTDVIWNAGSDDELGEKVKVTLIYVGLNMNDTLKILEVDTESISGVLQSDIEKNN